MHLSCFHPPEPVLAAVEGSWLYLMLHFWLLVICTWHSICCKRASAVHTYHC